MQSPRLETTKLTINYSQFNESLRQVLGDVDQTRSLANHFLGIVGAVARRRHALAPPRRRLRRALPQVLVGGLLRERRCRRGGRRGGRRHQRQDENQPEHQSNHHPGGQLLAVGTESGRRHRD